MNVGAVVESVATKYFVNPVTDFSQKFNFICIFVYLHLYFYLFICIFVYLYSLYEGLIFLWANISQGLMLEGLILRGLFMGGLCMGGLTLEDPACRCPICDAA